jgi:hypothetical protein
LLGPRVRRSAAMVAATPPPTVTAPWLQSSVEGPAVDSVQAAALAAAISAALKDLEVGIGFLTIGIAA